MPAGDIETCHADGAWRNRVEAQERQVEHIIRNLDGTIAERHTYGHDPRDIKG